MPTPKISSRPQTLRQARRAYQKAGATTRLSERQMKQLERSAELQERADRIKERENRRKANLKKKNEKIEREREARARMGIPSPVKEDVGASQMRLGAFLAVGVGIKTKCEGPRTLGRKIEIEESHAPLQKSTPSRSPLQPRSGNGISKPSSQKKSPKALRQLSATSSPCDGLHRLPETIQKNTEIKASRPLPIVSNQRPPTARSAELVKTNTTTSMRPPPLPLNKPHKPPSVQFPSRPPKPPPMHQPIPPTTRFQTRCHTKTPSKPIPKPPRITAIPPPPILANKPPPKPPSQRPPKPTYSALPKPQPILDEWVAFLVSNTQIERELSTPEPTADPIPYKPQISISPSLFLTQSEAASTPCPAPLPKSSNLSTGCLLALATEQVKEQDFEEDITDGDLEGAALEAELGAMPKLKDRQQQTGDQEKTGQTDSFYDDEFDLSTQEWRHLVD